MDIKVKKVLEKLSQNIREGIHIIDEVGISLHGNKIGHVNNKMFYNLLIRQRFLAQGIKVIIDSTDNSFWKLPISILCRVGLTDFITLEYLINTSKKGKELTKEYEMLSTTLLRRLAKEDFFEKDHEFLQNHFSSLDIEKDIKSTITVKKMTEEIDEGTRIYNLYTKLSQYEHFNKFSVMLLETKKLDKDIKDFEFCVFQIFTSVFLLIRLLNPINKAEFLDKINKVCSKIIEE